MKICKKHNLPLIWGRKKGINLIKYCTECLDEEWEQDFKQVRERWKDVTYDEILIEIGLFYQWMLDKGYSKNYAKSISFRARYLLKALRTKGIEINEENINDFLKDRRPYLRTYYKNAFKKFIIFKREFNSL